MNISEKCIRWLSLLTFNSERVRIDKYLWCVRYYKTRNMATEACKKGHIRINGEIAKASKEVFPQDELQIRKDQVTYLITVTDLPASRVGAKLVDLYRTDHTPVEAFQHAELQALAQSYYREKGEGRPTKKDRRQLDEWMENND